MNTNILQHQNSPIESTFHKRQVIYIAIYQKGKIKLLNMMKNNAEGRYDLEQTCPLPPLLLIINLIKCLGK